MATIPSIPLPLDPSPPQEADDKRLWVGNLDNRLTDSDCVLQMALGLVPILSIWGTRFIHFGNTVCRYCLIKILQKFGSVKKFDFLFHKSGPLKGQPRGYCFVTYESRSQAENALRTLNGKLVLSKKLSVKWANSIPSEDGFTKKSLGINVQQERSNKSLKSQISAIEAKLRSMEDDREIELERCLTATVATTTTKIPPLKVAKTNHSQVRGRPYPDRKHHNR